MKIELSLYSPYELRAFAAFCTTLADGRVPSENEKDANPCQPGPEPVVIYAGGLTPAGEAAISPVTEVVKVDATGETVVATEDGKVEKAKRTRKAKEEKPQISTNPENRVEPEVAAQDAADEKAEAAEQPKAAGPTHDDIRAILGTYGRLYGMPAAMEDGPQIIGTKKISDLTDDQIPVALAAAQKAVESNPFSRTPATA